MRRDEFYFHNLCECVEKSFHAAQFLSEVVKEFDRKTLQQEIDRMHGLEQSADVKKHEMMDALNRAFITPIEREDLVALSDNLDDITDAIEEVLLQIYMCNVQEIRQDVYPTIKVLLACIRSLGDVLKEFDNLKSSTTISKHIVKVNDPEEQGDDLYKENMYRLYQEEDVRCIVMWRNIYECIENCFDTCEHAADIVQAVIMKNS